MTVFFAVVSFLAFQIARGILYLYLRDERRSRQLLEDGIQSLF